MTRISNILVLFSAFTRLIVTAIPVPLTAAPAELEIVGNKSFNIREQEFASENNAFNNSESVQYTEFESQQQAIDAALRMVMFNLRVVGIHINKTAASKFVDGVLSPQADISEPADQENGVSSNRTLHNTHPSIESQGANNISTNSLSSQHIISVPNIAAYSANNTLEVYENDKNVLSAKEAGGRDSQQHQNNSANTPNSENVPSYSSITEKTQHYAFSRNNFATFDKDVAKDKKNTQTQTSPPGIKRAAVKPQPPMIVTYRPAAMRVVANATQRRQR